MHDYKVGEKVRRNNKPSGHGADNAIIAGTIGIIETANNGHYAVRFPQWRGTYNVNKDGITPIKLNEFLKD